MRLIAGLALACGLVATAHADAPLTLTSSRTCDGLRDLMVDTLVYQAVAPNNYYGGYPYYRRGGAYYPDEDMPVPASAPGAKSAAERAPSAAPMPVQQGPVAGPSHYTTTNVHEQGVDEADIVKTDGRYIYTLRNSELVIAKTWPVEKTDVVARVTFKTLGPQQLYLHGNDIIIQGYASEQLAGWNQGRTRILVIDATDRTAPKLRRILDVEGGTTASRLVGDDLYMVQTTYAQMPAHLSTLVQTEAQKLRRADQQTLRPWEIQARLAATLRHTLYGAVTRADIESMLPRVRTGGIEHHMACDDLYVPPNTMQLGMTTLAKLSLRDNDATMVGAMVNGGTVYASTNALFIAAPFYTYRVDGTADYGTQVHEFALGEKLAYLASGRVDGQVLNEFSMSEYNGDLRIATTDWQWNGQQGGNDLYVLRPFGRELRTIGALRGLAKGERIYAGRMIGDKGYLVTFRQTDPLFTLDLRDPTHPRVAGELKINGFSNYIHPVGGDMLLTIGQDADAAGRPQGLQVALFDVSDPENPTRRFKQKLAGNPTYAYSAAAYDPHAFTWDAVTGTLALPVTESNGTTAFTGLALFKVDPHHGIRRLGRIDHRVVGGAMLDEQCREQTRLNNGVPPYNCDEAKKQSAGGYAIERSIIVDKYILSLSSAGLEIHALSGLDLKASLTWKRVQQQVALAR
jgi:uncharacterized secreted protein with C-terminal beta-propeller domain